MTTTTDQPDAPVSDAKVTSQQSRITNGAGITMVGAGVYVRCWAAQATILGPRISRMLAIRGTVWHGKVLSTALLWRP